LRTAIFALACLLAAPFAARADLRAALDWERLHDCRTGAAVPALREDARLNRAAEALAAGKTLHEALARSGYLALHSTSLHLLGGAGTDAEVAQGIGAHGCRTLADPALTAMGAARRVHETWIVLAAPLELPAQEAAGAFDQRIVDLVNAARSRGRQCGAKAFAAAAPLRLNAALTRAAVDHAREMARYLEFDHRGHDGSTPAQRIRRAGYGQWRLVGENIAAGPMTAPELVQGWLSSPPHCENIMDARFADIGIGFAVNVASPQAVYWSQEFAAPRAR
jgi:uncharacterized protein YkwD